MNNPLSKIKRSVKFHYYRVKNDWVFPEGTSHLTGGDIAKGDYEPMMTKNVENYLSEGDLFIDVGANVGYYSRIASDKVGRDGAVYAFEAETNNFYALYKNTQLLDNVVAMNFAASDKCEIVKLYQSRHPSSHSMHQSSRNLDGKRFTVPTITLDDFWEKYLSKSKIKLIKIDVEGAELNVLRGMEKILSSGAVNNILIEYHRKILHNKDEISKEKFNEILSLYTVTLLDKKNRVNTKITTIEDFLKITEYEKDDEYQRNINFIISLTEVD